ncbi:MAG TPA: type I phosphomannose isomerase catalytic subunit [Thermomicrobiales bacterium]|nr:type I phosphomannose isomerase catalytic subunit [Thermomicrobiales bacterium]
MSDLAPFLLITHYQPRVWGGGRLARGPEPIGEAWGAWEGNLIASGPDEGLRLDEACRRYGADLLGTRSVARHGERFPILTKLIDTREWLSVQLHPNDAQAEELEGAGQLGKTEAWYLIETAPDAEIILGLREGVDRAEFAAAIRAGRVLDAIARQPARAGDTWFIPAGTVHALGPGIFLFEVQQSSDITYRVYDWDRPASAGRELHIEQAIRCVEPGAGERIAPAEPRPREPLTLIESDYFTLARLLVPEGSPARLDTAGESFHALTCIAGEARISSPSGDLSLPLHATAIVPAATGAYEVHGSAELMLSTA